MALITDTIAGGGVPKANKVPSTNIKIDSLWRSCQTRALPWMTGPLVTSVDHAFADMPNFLSDGTPVGNPSFSFPNCGIWSYAFYNSPQVKRIPLHTARSNGIWEAAFQYSGMEVVESTFFNEEGRYVSTFRNCLNLTTLSGISYTSTEHRYIFKGVDFYRCFDGCERLELENEEYQSVLNARIQFPQAKKLDRCFYNTLIHISGRNFHRYNGLIIDAPVCTSIQDCMSAPTGAISKSEWSEFYLLAPKASLARNVVTTIFMDTPQSSSGTCKIVVNMDSVGDTSDELFKVALFGPNPYLELQCRKLLPRPLVNLGKASTYDHHVIRYCQCEIYNITRWEEYNVARYMIFDGVTFTNPSGLTTIGIPSRALRIDLRTNCVNASMVQTICAATSPLYTVRIID